MISNKNKPSDYICLSEKDRQDKKKWFSNKKTKPKSKANNKQLMDKMADKLKGRPYSEFLKSKYWSIVRQRVLQRDGSKCVICSYSKNLQVHHDNYKNHFREHRHLNNLMTLCGKCHKEHHYCTD